MSNCEFPGCENPISCFHYCAEHHQAVCVNNATEKEVQLTAALRAAAAERDELKRTVAQQAARITELEAAFDYDDKHCPLCTWRGPVELVNGVCPQCDVDWPKSYRDFRDSLTVARERIAQQAAQLEQAGKLIELVHELSLLPRLRYETGLWIAANAPAPKAEATK